jgi:hypothetical protein
MHDIYDNIKIHETESFIINGPVGMGGRDRLSTGKK